MCYISQGDYATAYSYTKESVELRQERTLEYFGANTTAERAEYWGNQSHLFQNTYPAVAFEVYNPEDTTGQREMLEDLYNKSALFAKGLLLTSENEFKNIILDSPNENVKRMFSKLQEINIKLKELKEQPSPGQNDIVLQLEQEAKTIEKELLTISKEYRDFRNNLKITWDSVQAKLGDNDIAIEFLSFPKLGTDGTMYIALTVRPGYTHPHMTVLCDEKDIIASADKAYTSPELSMKIWGPLAQELDGVKNIYFSPCGELHKIGIESMPHWSKRGVMVNDSVEGFNIYRLSSTRELALNRTPIESTGAAVFGGIMYDITDEEKLGVRYKGHEDMYATRGSDFGDVDLRGISTDYLSASLDEVKSIKSILGRKNMPVVYKTSADATEASFKALSGQGKGIIHIATHGFFLTDSAARAEKQQNNIRFLTDDAMTHSGLLFAAAAITVKYHKKVSESYEDGVLTAYEVSQLNLRGWIWWCFRHARPAMAKSAARESSECNVDSRWQAHRASS
ncbi:MAG: CHAT domain-containing protein [Muribaculaceae bacterium]|nr:CHAT domain-containing protein [Muribaculaceae bacterium]